MPPGSLAHWRLGPSRSPPTTDPIPASARNGGTTPETSRPRRDDISDSSSRSFAPRWPRPGRAPARRRGRRGSSTWRTSRSPTPRADAFARGAGSTERRSTWPERGRSRSGSGSVIGRRRARPRAACRGASAPAGRLPVPPRAAEDDVAIDLILAAEKTVVLQGDRGLSQKGPEPGNASYYYSLSRMSAQGTVRVGGEPLSVSGLAWMDREWSTSALGPELVGWDWLALQLDDGREIMVYRLRRRDGSTDAHSAGSLVSADGAARSLPAADVPRESLHPWTSPRSRVRYPSRWRLAVPRAGLALEIV